MLDKVMVEKMFLNPGVEQKNREEIADYWIEESFTYIDSNQYIKGTISCGKLCDKCFSGSVDVYFFTEKFKIEHHAGFGYLEVQTPATRQRIGTKLMLRVFEIIKLFKEYYSVNIPVAVSGWLSSADRGKNWEIAIPFYEKVGELAKVKCNFLVRGDDSIYTAREFLSVADTDGDVVFLV